MARDLKVILEGLLWYKRTLRDKCWTIIIICVLLEETMPVLWGNTSEIELAYPPKKKTHDGGGQVQGVVLEFINDIDAKSASLQR